MTIGRVRQAYGLTAREGEMLVQALWPDAVQPLELWRTTYESCWQAFMCCSLLWVWAADKANRNKRQVAVAVCLFCVQIFGTGHLGCANCVSVFALSGEE